MNAKTKPPTLSAVMLTLCLAFGAQGSVQDTAQFSTNDETLVCQSTFTTVQDSGRKKDVKEIWSSNRNFYAIIDRQEHVTTVYGVKWTGKIGRSEKLWRLDKSFETAWLSNDGRHLTTGHHASGLIPLECDRDQAMIIFFNQGEVVKVVQLKALIPDLSDLKKTDAGYTWGHYLELNAAGHFVVQLAHGKQLLFDVSTGQQTRFRSEGGSRFPGWAVYQDVMRCYEFQYPNSWFTEEHLSLSGRPTGWTSIKEKNKGWVISTSIEDMAAFSSYGDNPEKRSFQDFVMFRARAMFCADGPNGSSYIKEAISNTEFTNPNGVKGLELFLRQVHQTYGVYKEKTRIEEKTIGPIYAMSLSGSQELHRFLFFEVDDAGLASDKQKALLQDIVATVRILQPTRKAPTER